LPSSRARGSSRPRRPPTDRALCRTARDLPRSGHHPFLGSTRVTVLSPASRMRSLSKEAPESDERRIQCVVHRYPPDANDEVGRSPDRHDLPRLKSVRIDPHDAVRLERRWALPHRVLVRARPLPRLRARPRARRPARCETAGGGARGCDPPEDGWDFGTGSEVIGGGSVGSRRLRRMSRYTASVSGDGKAPSSSARSARQRSYVRSASASVSASGLSLHEQAVGRAPRKRFRVRLSSSAARLLAGTSPANRVRFGQTLKGSGEDCSLLGAVSPRPRCPSSPGRYISARKPGGPSWALSTAARGGARV
jgi:hypothetical protein